jgi:hypothetical protein
MASLKSGLAAWRKTAKLLAAQPAVGEVAFIRALADRTRELLPDRDFEIRTNGATITVEGCGAFSGNTNIMMPVFILRLPAPVEERLAMVIESHGKRLQEFLARAYGEPWPGPKATARACITSETMSLWWGGPAEADALERLRPIDRAEVGI